MIVFILDTNLLIRSIALASVGCIVVIICMILFIIFYMSRRGKKTALRKKLKLYFSDIISNICVCESSEELAEMMNEKSAELISVLNKNKLATKVFIKELHKVQQNLSGQAMLNITEIYKSLGMVQETLAQLHSNEWHKNVNAIQQLAAFKQVEHITDVYNKANDNNQHIRDAAQIAIVQLTGFKGLQFLKQITRPISEWQQLLLLQQLDGEDIKTGQLNEWIQSQNDTVVEFILRLIEKFTLYECLDNVYTFLNHKNKAVRIQALKVIKEMQDESTMTLLQNIFYDKNLEEQAIILEILCIAGSEEQMPFLTTLLDHENELIKYKALCCMKAIQPEYTEKTMQELKHNPLFNYILPIVKEQMYS